MALAAGLRLPLRTAQHVGLRIAARLGADVPKPIPFFILKVTDVCNARCLTCNVGLPAAHRSSASMPLPLALAVVRQMARRRALFAGIVGGEPLLYKHLFEVLELCSSLGIRTNMNTHGGLLTDDIARRLADARLSYVSISLDSPDAARNEAVRRGVRFDDVLAAIRAMRRRSPETAVSIGMTITRQNVGDMVGMCRLAAREGVRYLKFQPFHTHLDQLAPGPDLRSDMALTEADLPELLGALRAAQDASREVSVVTNARMLLHELPAAVAGARTLPCVAGDAILFIEPSGRAGGCPEKRSRGTLAEVDLDALMEAEADVFQLAARCPLLPSCFDTTYGELSHILGRNDIGRTLDLIERVLFYR